jgi:hypothetical protein
MDHRVTLAQNAYMDAIQNLKDVRIQISNAYPKEVNQLHTELDYAINSLEEAIDPLPDYY